MPSFEWMRNENSSTGVPLLRIRFQDNGTDDFAVLNKFNPIPQSPNESVEEMDDCIFSGFLKDESNVYVTLTGGCPFENSFEV